MGKSAKTKMTQLIMKRALSLSFHRFPHLTSSQKSLISHVGNPLVMIVFWPSGKNVLWHCEGSWWMVIFVITECIIYKSKYVTITTSFHIIRDCTRYAVEPLCSKLLWSGHLTFQTHLVCVNSPLKWGHSVHFLVQTCLEHSGSTVDHAVMVNEVIHTWVQGILDPSKQGIVRCRWWLPCWIEQQSTWTTLVLV